VNDLMGLINALSYAPAHIVGNSFGASMVSRTVCIHPEVIRPLAVHELPLIEVIAGDPACVEASQKEQGGYRPYCCIT